MSRPPDRRRTGIDHAAYARAWQQQARQRQVGGAFLVLLVVGLVVAGVFTGFALLDTVIQTLRRCP